MPQICSGFFLWGLLVTHFFFPAPAFSHALLPSKDPISESCRKHRDAPWIANPHSYVHIATGQIFYVIFEL